MKFCMQCGAELSEEAKFCRSCGAKVSSSEALGTFKAPDDEGEFVLTSWKESDTEHTATKHEEVSKKEEPDKKEKTKDEEKKQGCLSYLFLYAKVLFIAIGSVFLLVIIMELFSDDKPSTPEAEQNQPVKSQSDTTINNVIPKGDESIFPKAEELERTDVIEPNEEERLQSNDDMTPQERAVFIEALIERSEAELEEELAKGDAADMEKVKEIREGIAKAREVLNELK